MWLQYQEWTENSVDCVCCHILTGAVCQHKACQCHLYSWLLAVLYYWCLVIMFDMAACVRMSIMTHFKTECVSPPFIYTLCLVVVSFFYIIRSLVLSNVTFFAAPSARTVGSKEFTIICQSSELWMNSAFQPLPWSLTSNSPDIYSWFSRMQRTLHWPTSPALQLCWGLNTNYFRNEIHPITLFSPSLHMLFGVTASSLCRRKI